MAKLFEDFLITVPDEHQAFVAMLHDDLTEQGCALVVKEAKSGYMISYKWQNKSVLNWVFRKAGMLARIYGDHLAQYEDVIAKLPVEMKKKMIDAPNCRRLLDPTACSPKCVMGFVYNLDGEFHQKCRNGGMFFLLSKENTSHIRQIINAELTMRKQSA